MIPIAIAVLVALGALVLFTTTHRRDAGRLSRETVRKDRSDSPFLAEDAPPTGRDVERMAREASNAPGTAATVGETRPRRLGAARPRDARRHPPAVLQPRHRRHVRPRPLGGFGAACLAFLWPGLSGGFGSKITVGKLDDILAPSATGQALLLPRRPLLPQPVPDGRRGQGQEVLLRRRPHGHGGGRRGALPEVRAPRLPRAVLRHVAVVRVPLPRLAVQPGRARRRAARPPRPRPLPRGR